MSESLHGNGMVVELTPVYRIGARSLVHEPAVLLRPHMIEFGRESRVDSFVKIEGGEGVKIGDGVHIASFCHVNVGGGRTTMEDGTALASGARIISGGNQPEGVSCSAAAPSQDQVVERGEVVMRRNSILYANATVYAGHGKKIVIGEGARVAAHSLVTRDVPPNEIWGGVPARFLRRVER